MFSNTEFYIKLITCCPLYGRHVLVKYRQDPKTLTWHYQILTIYELFTLVFIRVCYHYQTSLALTYQYIFVIIVYWIRKEKLAFFQIPSNIYIMFLNFKGYVEKKKIEPIIMYVRMI